MKSVGITIVLFGCILILIGILVLFSDKIPFFGKMPGDINMKWSKGSFHFPIVTCIIISIMLTVLVNILLRFFRS